MLGACTSPEATRTRASGPGGDTGNRGGVELHEGSQPYWRTPRRIAEELTTASGPARQPEPSSGGAAPAASPR